MQEALCSISCRMGRGRREKKDEKKRNKGKRGGRAREKDFALSPGNFLGKTEGTRAGDVAWLLGFSPGIHRALSSTANTT